MNKDGDLFARVRSALADTLLCVEEPPAMQMLPIRRFPGMIFLLFFDGGSQGNPGPGGSGSVIVLLNIATLAACVLWVSSMAYSAADITNNTAEYWGLCTVYVTRMYLATPRCISLGIVRWCSHSLGPIIPRRRPAWCRYFGRHVPLRKILKSPSGAITIVPTTKLLID